MIKDDEEEEEEVRNYKKDNEDERGCLKFFLQKTKLT